uniref:YiiX/YebB-like N1pC/P60 family cysteine hydrolase n=1 Tax=Halobacteriovorax sp. TaxID=2020862 RepID=UPI0035629153
MIKHVFLKLILSATLVDTAFALTQLEQDIEKPDALYRHSAAIINQSVLLTGDSEEVFRSNREAYKDLANLMERVDAYSAYLASSLKNTLSNGRVINGEKVYHISSLINVYHGLSIKFNELNTYAKPTNINNFLTTGNIVRFGKDLLWLASYTKLYKSFYNNYLNYYTHINLRKIVKNLIETKRESRQVNVDELFAMAAHTFEKENRKKVKEFFKAYIDYNVSKTRRLDFHELVEIIYYEIDKDVVLNTILSSNTVNISNYTFTDTLMTFFGKVTNAISGIFGNLVGKVRWRHGYFYKDTYVESKLIKNLKPLDIIFEKTPFALTDALIPGHFGHAALYLGTEEQLKDIGMWSTKTIEPFHNDIRSGKVIIEAVRPGVRLTTLKKFMEIDEIAIVRQPEVADDFFETMSIYKRAIDQLGKEYDFNFDVETTDKIVCSELLFFAFGKINWPTAYILGRPTISPDNLAELTFYDQSPIKFVLNYWSKKKGEIIEGDINQLAEN